MSGTALDLLSVAQQLAGANDGSAGAITGRVSSKFVGIAATYSPASSGENSGQTFTVTAATQESSQLGGFPALQFSNARDIINSDGTTSTEVDVQRYTSANSVVGQPITTYLVVAADAHHVLLVVATDPANTQNGALLIADDNSLNRNDPSYYFKNKANPVPQQISDTTANGTPNVPCFAAGTLLRVDAAESAVETLIAGDMVMTFDGSLQPVTWVGSRTVDLTATGADALQPVRIKAHAFAEGQPARDLVVSPDHALFVDGVFVAAKMLVNGGSITAELGFTSVTYYHVELARHSVVFAEGLPAETYLDSGNRHQFGNDTGVVDFATPTALYDAQGFAPLALDEHTVRPIWARLADRSGNIGLTVGTVTTSADPDLRLIVGGRELRAVRVDGTRHVFAVPAGAQSIRVVSRSARPTDTHPWLADRRSLGVAISRLAMTDATGSVELPLKMDGEGWWASEGRFRWTNGDAAVAIVPASTARTVEIDVQGTVSYPIQAAA